MWHERLQRGDLTVKDLIKVGVGRTNAGVIRDYDCIVMNITNVRHSYAAQGNHRRYLSSSSKGNSARMNNGVDKVGIGDGYGEDNISGSEGF